MRPLSAFLLMLMLGGMLAACGAADRGGGASGGAPAGALEITMLYGSEKQTWIEATVKTFNAQAVKSTGGKPIYVTATPAGSNESLNQILSGQAQPVIWSPASSVLIPVANERWGQAHNGERLVPDTPQPLVLSPVVIAMWRPMAQALGWPDKPLGWSDIATLAKEGRSWADYEHPEWGPFQFGHTHPDYSNSGIVSVLAMAYAAAGKTRGLTVADVQSHQTSELIGAVERGVIHYGESTGFFAEQMFSRGPSYLSAAVLYENLVIESRDTSRYPNLTLPVVAIYPKEGTLWTDHPFVVPNAAWVDAEKRAAAETFRAFLMERPQQELALKLGFRPGDPSIPIGAPIDLANGVDPAQPKTLLEVPGADVIEAVRAVWGQNKKHVDVMAVLDISGSMQEEDRLGQAKAALQIFVRQLADEDGFGLTIFSDSATVLTPISPIGPKRQQLLDQIGGLFPQGGTRLFDTVGEAYEPLLSAPADQRIRALVVLTDGADNKSIRPFDQLLEELQQDQEGRSIKIFTIAFGGDAQVELLKRMAEASGARSYVGKPGETGNIERVYRDIATFF